MAGAGVIGLSIALELAERGFDVTVLERGFAMREASWAAAGMLAATDPENPLPLRDLANLSLSLYPAFLRHVEQLSGMPVPFRTASTLQFVPHSYRALANEEVISTAEAAQRVPGIPSRHHGSFLWLHEHSLDPRDLARALPLAARAAGIALLEHSPVTALEFLPVGIAVAAGSSPMIADALVAASGAWTLPAIASLLGREQNGSAVQAPPAIPRKGQMIAVRLPKSTATLPAHQLTSVLRSPDVYLVPRGDGRVIIGATVEDAGFDRTVRAEATAWLLDRAAELWPPLKRSTLEDAWTGIRPASPDGLPVIGEVVAPHLWIATGHYRNGILLAPATAHLLATEIGRRLSEPQPTGPRNHLSISSQACSPDLLPFQPSRFQPVTQG